MRKSFLEWFAWGCLLCSSTAWADPDDTLSFVVGAGLMHDDNLFKAPSFAENTDEIRSTTLGLKLDKEYSLQHFKVDATMTDYRYRDNSFLDYTGKNLGAAWLWKVSPTLYGTLSTSYVETLNSFLDYRAVTPERLKNIRTIKTSRFDVEWEALGPLHLLSGVSHTDFENSQTFIQEDNYTAGSGEFGIKYVTSAQSSLALVQRKTQGDYEREPVPGSLRDSGYDQNETELRFIWNPTVKSNLFGRVAYLERNYDTFSERDYSGYVGSVDFNWGVTEKVNVLFSARRDLSVYQDPGNTITSYSSYFKSTAFTVSPTWEITEKTRLILNLGREHRDYEGTIINGIPLRDDTIDYRGVTLVWEPRESINVSLGYRNQSRDSNFSRYDFDGNIYSLTVRLNF